ncbi:MAG: hypothetical protein Q7S21_02220, partial [archaeon]|nr:hypothetical protein [archaeon]
MAKDLEEKVLVVPREKLFGKNNEHYFEGFRSIKDFDYTDAIKNNSFFVWRHVAKDSQKISAEEDESIQQIIPYVIVKHKNKLFFYKRSNNISEARLSNQYTIGVGGHINPIDVSNGNDLIQEGMKRELEEEITIDKTVSPKIVGFINVETTPVDRVHFGLLYLAELPREE